MRALSYREVFGSHQAHRHAILDLPRLINDRTVLTVRLRSSAE
jgi:hypothetical protein